jgi:hypothetical protein
VSFIHQGNDPKAYNKNPKCCNGSILFSPIWQAKQKPAAKLEAEFVIQSVI